MIELPFTLEIDFELQDIGIQTEKVLHKIISNIKEISPTPILKIHIQQIEHYELIKKYNQNQTIQIDFFFNINENYQNTSSYDDVNLVIQLNYPNLYETVKLYNDKYKSIIIEPSKTLQVKDIKEFEKIKQDKSLHNIYLKPYLTEKELKDFANNNLNRPFLTCATAWFNPMIDDKGNISCCKYHTIGNILNSDLLDLWNNNTCNKFRETIISKKNLLECTQCLKKYNSNFLVVDNAEINYKNNKYKFKSELNHIISAPKVAIIGEKTDIKEYSTQAIPIYSDEEYEKIKNIILIILG